MMKIMISMCTKKTTYYSILNLTPSATPQQIKANYYQLAREFHPDKNSENVEYFKAINEAYQVLKDTSRRHQYDHCQTHGLSSNTIHMHTDHHYGYTVKKPAKSNPRPPGKEYRQESNYYKSSFTQSFVEESSKNKKITQLNESVMKILKGLFGVVMAVAGVEIVVYGVSSKTDKK